jgi:hypothetical protein
MVDLQDWHRMFGLSWQDFLHDMPVTVEVEKDLSLKQQFLDVVIIRRGTGPLPVRLPDGFEGLGPHNLISFKSHHEAFDPWAVIEHLGHYANYRKQASPNMRDLLPEEDFRLYAVSVRFPQALAAHANLQRVTEGVYDLRLLNLTVRLVVVHQLAREPHNAMLHLFSAQQEQVIYGGQNYRVRSPETTTFLQQLYARYSAEGFPMPITLEEFVRQARKEVIKEATVDERLEGLTPEQRLEGLTPEQLLRRLSPEQLLEGLSPEQRQLLLRRLAEEVRQNDTSNDNPGN